MGNFAKLFGIITMSAVIGLAMAACKTPPPADNTFDIAGKTLYLNHQRKIALSDDGVTFKEYNEKDELENEGSYSYSTGNKTITLDKEYAYQVSANNALLIQGKLPGSKGSNELQGKTFTATASIGITYTFAASGNTYTVSYYDLPEMTGAGSYACDSASKTVWLKPEKVDGKTMLEYYNNLIFNNKISFNSNPAAETNERFGIVETAYNLSTSQIGD